MDEYAISVSSRCRSSTDSGRRLYANTGSDMVLDAPGIFMFFLWVIMLLQGKHAVFTFREFANY